MPDLKNVPEGIFLYRTRCHFDEMDGLWVLHHSRYLKMLERACQAMFDEQMGAREFSPKDYPDVYVVVKNVNIDYLAPINNVMPITVLLRIVRVREAGLVTAFEFRNETGDTLFATGTRTVCKLDLNTHKPTGWSREFREKYETLCEMGKAVQTEWIPLKAGRR